MYKLKPCPFCGGEAIFESYGRLDNDYKFSVKCKDCYAGIPKGYRITLDILSEDGQIKIINDGRIEAIEDWNRRI